MRRTALALTAASLTCLLLAGCHVSSNKDGNKENVDIGTPFGSMQVKTNDAADLDAIGLTAYPGAVPAKDGNDNDSQSANVNMSFGSFHLGVKAAKFQTTDQPGKVLDFYRKDLAKYGDVIECQHDKPIGTPTRTSQGLSCSDNHSTQISTGDDKQKGVSLHGTLNGHTINGSDNIDLRAGSEQHQHIVSVETKNGGTRIDLVLLDLPGHLDIHGKKDIE